MKHKLIRLINKKIFRFVGVAIIGEIIYLILFVFFNWLGISKTSSVIPSGIISIFFNSYSHARFSFRTSFNLRFLATYIAIQISCILITYFISFFLASLGMKTFSIGLATLIIWGTLSYLFMNLFLNFRK